MNNNYSITIIKIIKEVSAIGNLKSRISGTFLVIFGTISGLAFSKKGVISLLSFNIQK